MKVERAPKAKRTQFLGISRRRSLAIYNNLRLNYHTWYAADKLLRSVIVDDTVYYSFNLFVSSFSIADIKKRRFLQPLRGLRRIFRRKGRPVISTASDGNVDAVATLRSGNDQYYDTRRGVGGDVEASNLEPSKSHSTSQLIEDQIDNSHRR